MIINRKFFLHLLLTLISGVTLLCASDNDPTITYADSRLENIIHQQEKLLNRYRVDPSSERKREWVRLFSSIIDLYEDFLADNIKSEEGFLLYGKFLSQIGMDEEAMHAFLKVNRLNPKIAVVKQQIGNFLAEKGDFGLALAYFKSAKELEPNVGIYHYQFAELLHVYHKQFIEDNIFTGEEFDQDMISAFKEAARLMPNDFKMQKRYAEAFYDLEIPQWDNALALWQELEQKSPSVYDKDYCKLNRARVYLEKKEFSEARKILNRLFNKDLEKPRRDLLAEIQIRNREERFKSREKHGS